MGWPKGKPHPHGGIPAENFLKYISVMPSGCWEWTGYVRKDGYGNFWDQSHKRSCVAHRWGWENIFRGIIEPEELELDHLCRNRKCVNPEHLEVVTRQTNLLRGDTIVAKNAQKTHCPKGHPLSGGNLSYADRAHKLRRCRVCHNAAQRERTARMAAQTLDGGLAIRQS